jgi:hypothetical protein
MAEIVLLPLEQLTPDPDQPRRIIPKTAARAIAAGKKTAALVHRAYLAKEGKTPHDRRVREEIRSLAQNIAREQVARPETHGLVNPITVSKIGRNRYLIETGEVRFWAMIALQEAHPTDTAYAAIPTQIVKRDGATRRAAENLQRRSMNAMETAWALKQVWDELGREGPPPDFLAPGAKKSERGRPKEWPTWEAVADRVGLARRTAVQYATLLTLPAKAQTIIHAHDVPERRLRYLLQQLPRPKYNAEIVRILEQATGDETLWSGAQIRAAVDRMLKRVRPRARPAQIGQALGRVRGLVAQVFGRGKPDAARIRRYREALPEPERKVFDQTVAEARALLPYVSALARTKIR